jgi:hypothetical protein
MNNNKVILNPKGEAIDLSSVRRVTVVTKDTNDCWFEMYYKGLDGNCSLIFRYVYAVYSDSKDDLYSKVKNIRSEILRRMNDGDEVTEVLGGINLKKDGN